VKCKLDQPNRILSYILDKLADPKFSIIAEQIILSLLKSPTYDFTHLFHLILSKESYFNKQTINSHKQLVRRFQIAEKALTDLDFQINQGRVNINSF